MLIIHMGFDSVQLPSQTGINVSLIHFLSTKFRAKWRFWTTMRSVEKSSYHLLASGFPWEDNRNGRAVHRAIESFKACVCWYVFRWNTADWSSFSIKYSGTVDFSIFSLFHCAAPKNDRLDQGRLVALDSDIPSILERSNTFLRPGPRNFVPHNWATIFQIFKTGIVPWRKTFGHESAVHFARNNSKRELL